MTRDKDNKGRMKNTGTSHHNIQPPPLTHPTPHHLLLGIISITIVISYLREEFEISQNSMDIKQFESKGLLIVSH